MSVSHFATQTPEGDYRLNVMVDGMHCPSCVAIIEGALKKQPAIKSARLNLSTKRLAVIWGGEKEQAEDWVNLINSMGYQAVPYDPNTAETFDDKEQKFLLKCLAVAGFASGNLMLFSIPMWTSDGVEMGTATRTMFHWIQAIIAIPAVAYSGLPFYRSAWRAVKEWRTNMDVPISVAIILAMAMSVFETLHFGRHSYFDASVMLIFFLLIGRYLDVRTRGKARGAAHDLLQMMAGSATILHPDGRQESIPISEIQEGMTLLVVAGEKIGADGEVVQGVSELDTSLITGETLPQSIAAGGKVFAGMVNISAPLTITVTRAGEQSLLSDIVRLMENAEQSQARYVTVADKISGWYTPVVHILAAATFLGWWIWGQAEWQVALLYAATVLIITCPCALGLAVPVVQVLASSKLMKSGILIKSGSALERLAEMTHAVFDKTGTLTVGKPELQNLDAISESDLKLAASMAAQSKHPLSQALVRAYSQPLDSLTVAEVPGCGLEMPGVKLGKASWVGVKQGSHDAALELWLAREGQKPVRFVFADRLREDAKAVINTLQSSGIKTSLLSGDRAEVAQAVAQELGITNVAAGLSPVEKTQQLEALKFGGAKVLMVGDGLNDAPSLVSAHVSMSPSSAMDITQNAADIVFQGNRLQPVLTGWRVAVFSQKLVRENFILALLYNVIAIPVAVAGYATPLVAAIAMSSSSLIVIANAMRLNLLKEKR